MFAICSAVAALLTIALWPTASYAAIIPACEADFASSVLPAPPVPLEQSCDGSADSGDEIDNTRAAPMCDARGASAIAPPRVRGVSEQRFERGTPCEGGETLRAAVSPYRGDPPARPFEVAAEPAILPSIVMLAPPRDATLIDPLAPAGGPRAGVRHGIYHPPR